MSGADAELAELIAAVRPWLDDRRAEELARTFLGALAASDDPVASNVARSCIAHRARNRSTYSWPALEPVDVATMSASLALAWAGVVRRRWFRGGQ